MNALKLFKNNIFVVNILYIFIENTLIVFKSSKKYNGLTRLSKYFMNFKIWNMQYSVIEISIIYSFLNILILRAINLLILHRGRLILLNMNIVLDLILIWLHTLWQILILLPHLFFIYLILNLKVLIDIIQSDLILKTI